MPKQEVCVFRKLTAALHLPRSKSPLSELATFFSRHLRLEGGEHGDCIRRKYAKARSKPHAVVRRYAGKKGIRVDMTFKPTDAVILDLTVTCTACGYRIQPDEVILLAPQSLRCPKCQQVFPPSHGKVA
jgi:hypothetical protein